MIISLLHFSSFAFTDNIALNLPHSIDESKGFHLAFVDGMPHFQLPLSPRKGLPNFPEAFRLLYQPCF